MPAPTFQLPQANEKETYVQALFQRISPHYDLMNDLMTLGMHRLWKYQAIRQLNIQPQETVLDLCCGTGDLALSIAKNHAVKSVIGLDFCEPMLDIARQRGQKAQLNVQFLQGDALALPFENDSIDKIIVGYGLRNVKDYERCLGELYRVTRPGGKLVILDMSHPQPWADTLTKAYRFVLMPLLGKFIANDPDAYRYLSHSIAFFPNQQGLVQLLEKTGWHAVGYVNHMGGVCARHWGQK